MKSLERVRKREGRCYELAWRVMCDEPGADHFTLVHGCAGPNLIGHAWIDLNDGHVYDPVRNEYVLAADYAAFMGGAVTDHRYTRLEAMTVSAAAGHYGPWHATVFLSIER
jgi:hypothetical protein